jgi:hypothetical protein
MSKTPLFVMIGSGIIIVISLLMIGFGTADSMDIDVESNAIFQGTSGSVSVEEYGVYTILVNDNYRCDETTVSITDGTTEFFTTECDRDFDEVGWRAIGVMETNLNGELSVSANHEIIIVDDLIYLTEGGGLFLGGGGLCCIGIIGLVIGIVMAFKQKGKGGGQHVIIQQPMQQQPMQQQPMQQQPMQQQPMQQQPMQQQPMQQQPMQQQPMQQQPMQQQPMQQQPMQQQPMQQQPMQQQPMQQQHQQPPNDS